MTLNNSQRPSPGSSGVDVGLNKEIECMVEEGALPPFGVFDIQDMFEEHSFQIAFGFSQIDSMTLSSETSMLVLMV